MTLPWLYLCGPMTGLPDDNYPAFNAAAAELRAAGYFVRNPAETSLPKGRPWIEYMRNSVVSMMDGCEGLAYLPGHEASKGARIKIALATGLGWRVRPVVHWVAEGRAAHAQDAERIRADLISYLQRDLLEILKDVDKPHPERFQRILDLRTRIHALNPEAALYFNHGGPRPAHIPAPATAAHKSAQWWADRMASRMLAQPGNHDS